MARASFPAVALILSHPISAPTWSFVTCNENGCALQAGECLFSGLRWFNGGTLASAFNLYDSQGAQMNEPFLLNPSTPHTQAEIDRNRDPQTPSFDSDLNLGRSLLYMGAVNIVRRSGALYEEWQELWTRIHLSGISQV